MNKLIQAGDLINSGQHPGLPNARIPLWERGSNVLFEDRGVKPAPGQSSLFATTSADRITGLQTLYLWSVGVTTPGVIWGTNTQLFKGVTPPAGADVSRLVGGPYTGTHSHLWSIIQFGQAILATNFGKDEVQYLAPGAANFVDLSGPSDLPSTFRAKMLIVSDAFVLAFNTDNDPAEMRWCDEDDLLTWIPAPTNVARDLQLRDLLTDIVAVENFAEGTIVCGGDQAHYVQFTGPPFFFSQQHLLVGAGAVGPRAIIAFDRAAYGFSRQGIWETDGSAASQISTPSIQKYVYEDTFDAARGVEVVCWSDVANEQVYWSYPTKNGLGTTISFHRRDRLWTLHDYWRTAAAQAHTWPFPVLGSPAGGILGQGGGAGAVVGEDKPIGMSDEFEFTAGYGSVGYGGLGYGGQVVIG